MQQEPELASPESSTPTGDTPPARRVAFLGLGVMGYPMAGHLASAGHEVVVYNRSADKARRWVAEHGKPAAEYRSKHPASGRQAPDNTQV